MSAGEHEPERQGQADQYFESGSNTVPLLLLTAMQTSRKGKKWEHAGQKRREEMPSVYTGQTGSTARRRSDQIKIGRMAEYFPETRLRVASPPITYRNGLGVRAHTENVVNFILFAGVRETRR